MLRYLLIMGLLSCSLTAYAQQSCGEYCNRLIINLYPQNANQLENHTIPWLVSDSTQFKWSNIAIDEFPPDTIIETGKMTYLSQAFSYNIKMVYDIYENNQRIYGPLIEMTETGCWVDGKQETKIDSIFYTYTIQAIYQEPKPSVFECIINFSYDVKGEAPYQTNVNILNLTDQNLSLIQNTATFYRGLIALYYKTGCFANGYANCAEAASQDILPGKTSPWFEFTAGSDHLLGAQLSYAIDDPTLEDFHQVKVLIQNGEEVLDRCQAYIEPPTMGHVQYSAQATRVGDLDCQVHVIREEVVEAFYD